MDTNDSVLQTLRELLLGVDVAMKSHYTCLIAAIDTQRSVVDRMQTLAQRQSILLKSAPSRREYPKESCQRVEDDIKSDFHGKRNLLDESNIKLNSSLSDIRRKYCDLNEFIKTMDPHQISCLDKGDSVRPPTVYLIELFGDFLKFFTKAQSKMNCFAALLSADNIPSLNTYRKLLDLNKEFKDHFAKSRAYCSCLHSKAKT